LLKYLVENNRISDGVKIGKDEITFHRIIDTASRLGKLKSIKYLIDNKIYRPSDDRKIDYINRGIINGKIPVIKYFMSTLDGPLDESDLSTMLIQALNFEQKDVLRYLIKDSGYKSDKNTIRMILNIATVNGDKDILEFLKKLFDPQRRDRNIQDIKIL
jgi:hypothetical protein